MKTKGMFYLSPTLPNLESIEWTKTKSMLALVTHGRARPALWFMAPRIKLDF